MKNSDSFHISAQNIDCGYSLEPPQRGDSNEYLHVQSMFYYIKVAFKGSIYLKIRYFIIKEMFNKLMYGINTIAATQSIWIFVVRMKKLSIFGYPKCKYAD